MKKNISPQFKILISFLLIIIIGAFLLMLPFSFYNNTTFIDAFFIATSSVTITGLTTVDIASTYTLFGKIVILILIQIGGLSITTISFFLLTLLGAKIGFVQRDFIKESINVNSRQGIVKNILIIIKTTFIIELIGVIIFMIIFVVDGQNVFNALFNSLFHVISSFNNAGITILSSDSLVSYQGNTLFIIITTLLIVLGGMGTIVIYEIFKKRSIKEISLHSKIVLKMTILLFLIGFISFYLIEEDATILNSVFHAATIRTAGFYSYNYLTISTATLLIMLIIMFIGGSPTSSAGGVKVTNIYTVFKTIFNVFRKKLVLTNNKKITTSYQIKSFITVFSTILFLVVGVFSISLFDKNLTFSEITFESVSAISNTGLSLNVTNLLSVYSKIIIMILMLIGRVGVSTFIYALLIHETNISNIDYLEADYLI